MCIGPMVPLDNRVPYVGPRYPEYLFRPFEWYGSRPRRDVHRAPEPDRPPPFEGEGRWRCCEEQVRLRSMLMTLHNRDRCPVAIAVGVVVVGRLVLQ